LVSGNWSRTSATFTPGTYTVTFDATSSGKTITSAGSSFYNLTFNGVNGEWTSQDDITVTNNFTLTNGTFKLESRTLTVSADFRVDATFNAGTGKVVFNDASKITHVYGTTFADLEITTAGKEVQFEAGSTETVTGTLTITGEAGNLITLRSITSGSQWKLDPQGTRSISYVDVKDSWNIHSTVINPSHSIDSGNNTNWFLVVLLTSTDIEQSTKATDTTSTTEVALASQTAEASISENISLAEGEELVSTTEAKTSSKEVTPKAPEYESLFLCAGTDSRYQKCYAQGKYHTVVIVFAGKVVVGPYDEQGLKEEKLITLTRGQRITQEAQVR
jgi:hypothetical protein